MVERIDCDDEIEDSRSKDFGVHVNPNHVVGPAVTSLKEVADTQMVVHIDRRAAETLASEVVRGPRQIGADIQCRRCPGVRLSRRVTKRKPRSECLTFRKYPGSR